MWRERSVTERREQEKKTIRFLIEKTTLLPLVLTPCLELVMLPVLFLKTKSVKINVLVGRCSCRWPWSVALLLGYTLLPTIVGVVVHVPYRCFSKSYLHPYFPILPCDLHVVISVDISGQTMQAWPCDRTAPFQLPSCCSVGICWGNCTLPSHQRQCLEKKIRLDGKGLQSMPVICERDSHV